MPAYRDKDRNTWYFHFKYKDQSGKSRSKTKRGFATKKEAQNWENQFKLRESHELDMRFDQFYKLYLEYCQKQFKLNTIKTKDQIFTFLILPFFEEKRMNDITPAMAIAWQNILLDEKVIFENKMKPVKCKTMSHFIRKCVLESNIYYLFTTIQRNSRTAFRYASSANQIAKRVNSTGVIYMDDIRDIQSQIEHLLKEIWDIHSLLVKRTK